MRTTELLDNAAVAELLAREAEQSSGQIRQAFRRAARKAFLWEREAYDLLTAGNSLTELKGIGPFLARRIREWFEKPPSLVSPPKIRGEFLTLARARRVLLDHPSFAESLRGDLHAHTCWSDGTGTVAEMAIAAKDRGYRYLAITDHTKALKIARGLGEEQLLDQGKEIGAVNAVLADKAVDLVILKSAETNLTPCGQTDLEPSALFGLDLVLGSFHSALRRSEDQTERYLAALRNQTIHILGHPQGRIFNHRKGLSADWSRVFAEAARLDKAVEIDAYPDRQDLKLSLLRLALKEGARISLGTDSHHPWQLALWTLH
ncbi:MAG TPA: PHP domain-containing protein [Chthoniobacterales bacterium]|nr:PHP domain-containing protein [Chthoniobacterales bacterium]